MKEKICYKKAKKSQKAIDKTESVCYNIKAMKFWCSSQVVRPRSATPLSAGSNPACTSKTRNRPLRSVFCFGGVGIGLEMAL